MPNLLNRVIGFFKSAKNKDDSAVEDDPSSWQLPLSEAVNEAIGLLAFASRSGKALPPEYFKPILETARLINLEDGTKAIDAEQEQAFWKAYSALVLEISPVTSDSINATLEYHTTPPANHKPKRSIAQKTVLKYGIGSLVVLVLIIYFQSYMQMGMSIREHLRLSFHSQKQSIDNMFVIKIDEEDKRLKAAGLETQDNRVKKLYDNYKVEMELAKLRASQDELYSWGMGGDRVLAGLGMSAGKYAQEIPENFLAWLSATLNSTAVESPGSVPSGPTQPKQNQSEKQANPLSDAKMKSDNQANSLSDAKMKSDNQANPLSDAKMKVDEMLIIEELKTVVIPSYIALNESEQIIRLIGEFVLPLLYGLLGACAYVLRDLTNTIGSVTFSKSSMINYNLRLIMGPLVGIAVGLFLGSEPIDIMSNSVSEATTHSNATPSSVSSLSTGGLAFLAGYSVEMLFSALDNLVSAFARKDTVDRRDKPQNEVASG